VYSGTELPLPGIAPGDDPQSGGGGSEAEPAPDGGDAFGGGGAGPVPGAGSSGLSGEAGSTEIADGGGTTAHGAGGATGGTGGASGNGGKTGAGGTAGGKAGAGGTAGGAGGKAGAGGTAGNAGSTAGAGGKAGAGGTAGSAGGSTTSPCSAHPLTQRSTWVATASSSANGSPPSNILNGSLDDRWSTGLSQTNADWLQVDFGAVVGIDRVTLELGNNPTDFPRGYAVRFSNTSNNSAAPVLLSGVGQQATDTVLAFATPVSGRYLLIAQTGSVNGLWWSVAEIAVACSQ
jgi:hypothetical protein